MRNNGSRRFRTRRFARIRFAAGTHDAPYEFSETVLDFASQKPRVRSRQRLRECGHASSRERRKESATREKFSNGNIKKKQKEYTEYLCVT